MGRPWREWTEERKERARARARQRYARKRDVIRARKRELYAQLRARDPERLRERQRVKNARFGREAAQRYRQRNVEKVAQAQATWRSNNREYARELRLRDRFKISTVEYQRLLMQQGGVCAICALPESTGARNGRKPDSLAVDHCHVTKRIRGLLCRLCNSGLGFFRDDPTRLRAAILYLRNSL